MHTEQAVTPPTYFMELCPFVNFSMCLLNNFEILGDIFLKLGTNIKGCQMMCRERLRQTYYLSLTQRPFEILLQNLAQI